MEAKCYMGLGPGDHCSLLVSLIDEIQVRFGPSMANCLSVKLVVWVTFCSNIT